MGESPFDPRLPSDPGRPARFALASLGSVVRAVLPVAVAALASARRFAEGDTVAEQLGAADYGRVDWPHNGLLQSCGLPAASPAGSAALAAAAPVVMIARQRPCSRAESWGLGCNHLIL